MKKTSKSECASCPALCCEGLTIDIKKPRDKEDVEVLAWKLQYEPVGVYILNQRWHLFVEGRCGYLGDDDLCTRYESRPDTCRSHNPPDCERYVEWYDEFFETPDELEAYFEKEKRRKKRRRRARNNNKKSSK
jgi:Fe-S-cluster containining protein